MATALLNEAPIAWPPPAPVADDCEAPLLRFVTCGSVDDGKSTLIGRLLHDAGALFDDQVEALAGDSRRYGTRGAEIDYALLVDGLAPEREQGITIDVAYRYFSSGQRRFIVADSPGHEQYTRNMATAASTADLAILLIDATRGLTAQTRRHARIVRLLGVGTVVVAVNKMDRVGHDKARFDAIVGAFRAFAKEEALGSFDAVPIVAVAGGNIVTRSDAMPWYRGPTLLETLDQAPNRAAATGGFAMPVQWVSRPNDGFRGFAGTIARGSVRPGDEIVALPGSQTSRVARIVTFDGDLSVAAAGHAVTIVLEREIDCAAGATLAAAGDRPLTGDTFTADLIWFDDQPLSLGRSYLLQVGATRVSARIEEIAARLDGVAEQSALGMNGIASVRLRTDTPIAALPYADNIALGAFALIDRANNATVAAGMIRRREATGGNVGVPKAAPIYAFAPDDPAAIAAVARLRSIGAPAVLIDEAALASGIAGDVDTADRARFWRIARATAELFSRSGVTVAFAIDPPDGAPPLGQPWSADDGGHWVI